MNYYYLFHTIRQASTVARPTFSGGKSKYFAIAFGGTITFSLAYQAYRWMIQAPICPNFHRTQSINPNNVLACTALVRNLDKQCSGRTPMRKVGAATGVNFKLTKELPSLSTKIILNDNDLIERNIFNRNLMMDYFETLADLILKLDENHLVRLLTNLIGYYVFVCPECHSSITRQMISSTTYLNEVGLQTQAADMSEVEKELK